MTDSNDVDPDKASRIAKLFDIRLVVGGLLALYGVILLVVGLVETHPAKSTGLHLNLWTGLGMVLVGGFMLGWMKLRPLEPPKPDEVAEDEGPPASRAE